MQSVFEQCKARQFKAIDHVDEPFGLNLEEWIFGFVTVSFSNSSRLNKLASTVYRNHLITF